MVTGRTRTIYLDYLQNFNLERFWSNILYTNDLPSAVTSGSVFIYVCRWHHRLLHRDTVDNTVTSLNKALSELNSWCLESSLIHSLGKVRSYAIGEKTAHQAAKFCDYWRGSDRVGETLSSFGRHYRWEAFLVTSPYRCKKEFRKQTEPPEKEFVLDQKRPIGLVLQDNITISSIWTSRLGRLP